MFHIAQKVTRKHAEYRPLTGALRDTDASVLIFGIRVGLHLKRLLVVDQSLGTLGHAGSGVVEMTTCLHRYTQVVSLNEISI